VYTVFLIKINEQLSFAALLTILQKEKFKKRRRRMSLASLPDSVLRQISEFTAINGVLRACPEFFALRYELYEAKLNRAQSTLYFHANCRESYIKHTDDKYYVSDVAHNQLEHLGAARKRDYSYRRLKRPLVELHFTSVEQIEFYRKIRRVHLILCMTVEGTYNRELLFSRIGACVIGLRVHRMRSSYMKYLTNLTHLQLYGYDSDDLRPLSALQHLTINTILKMNKRRTFFSTFRCMIINIYLDMIDIQTSATNDEIHIWYDKLDVIQLLSICNIVRGSIHVRDVDLIFLNYNRDTVSYTDSRRIIRLDTRRFLVDPIE
jgi:hypothetical protein